MILEKLWFEWKCSVVAEFTEEGRKSKNWVAKDKWSRLAKSLNEQNARVKARRS